MADLHVYPNRLEIRLTRAEKVLSFRRDDLVLEREAIRKVALTSDPWIWVRGIRAPGAGIPLALAVGVRKFHGGQDFVVIKGKTRAAVVIDMDPESVPAPEFARVIVSTPHAVRLVRALRVVDPADQDGPDGQSI